MNRSEELTLDRLRDLAATEGVHVFPKIRVADVLPIDSSGLRRGLVQFGMMAHFDFVVADSGYESLFAVEFDGPQHSTSEKQKTRDQKKNAICETLHFPLLRVNSRYINQKYRGLDLLSYFTRVWFASDAWNKAQADGLVPEDEPFFPSFVMSEGPSSTKFPYWLSLDVQLELQAMQKAGLILHDVTSDWIGTDSKGTYHCLAWLQVSDKDYVASVDTQNRPLVDTSKPAINRAAPGTLTRYRDLVFLDRNDQCLERREEESNTGFRRPWMASETDRRGDGRAPGDRWGLPARGGGGGTGSRTPRAEPGLKTGHFWGDVHRL